MSQTTTQNHVPEVSDLFGEQMSLNQVQVQTSHGWLVTILAKGGVQTLQLCTMLIIARILAPEDFGLLAMVMAVIGFAGAFTDLGLSAATVRQPHITREQVNSLFWINISAGALMTLAGWVLALVLNLFYDDPRVQPVALALSCTFFLGALGTQHVALLRRNLRFRQLAWISVLCALAGNATMLVLAYAGAGYWALVASALSGCVVGTMLSWYWCRWRPAKPRLDPSVRRMVSFGGYIVGFVLLGFLAQSIPNLIIGSAWGAAAVGLYSRAQGTLNSMLGYVLEPLQLVAPAALSRLQSNTVDYDRYYLKIVTMMLIISAPVGFLVLILGEEIIYLLLGSQWGDTVPMLRWIAIGVVPQTVCYSTGWIYLSRGDSRGMLQWGIIGWLFLFLCLMVGVQSGAEGVAVAYSGAMFILFWPCMRFAFRGTDLTMTRLLSACWRPVFAALLTAAAVWELHHNLSGWFAWQRLSACLLVYAILYITLLVTLFGQRELLLELVAQLRRRIARV